jgi:hypothetical protein
MPETGNDSVAEEPLGFLGRGTHDRFSQAATLVILPTRIRRR